MSFHFIFFGQDLPAFAKAAAGSQDYQDFFQALHRVP
jgi:hypothetical protein